MAKSLLDIGERIRNLLGGAQSFVRQNPTPAGYVNRQFQQRVAQPIAQRTQQYAQPVVRQFQQVAPRIQQRFQQFAPQVQRAGNQFAQGANQFIQSGINRAYGQAPIQTPKVAKPFTILPEMGREFAKGFLTDVNLGLTTGRPETNKMFELASIPINKRTPQQEQEYRKLAVNEGLTLAMGMTSGGKNKSNPNLGKAYKEFIHNLGALTGKVGQKFSQAELDNAVARLSRIPAGQGNTFTQRASSIARYIQGVKAGVLQNVPSGVGLNARPIRSVEEAEKFAKSKPNVTKGRLYDIKPEEVKRVSENILKNNPGITRYDAEAMARDVIRNRPFNKSKVIPPSTGGEIGKVNQADAWNIKEEAYQEISRLKEQQAKVMEVNKENYLFKGDKVKLKDSARAKAKELNDLIGEQIKKVEEAQKIISGGATKNPQSEGLLVPGRSATSKELISNTIPQTELKVNSVGEIPKGVKEVKPLFKIKEKVDPFVEEMDAQVGKPINIQPKKPLPSIAGSDARQIADKAQINAEGNQKGFQKIFSQFIGERDSARTKGTVVGSNIRILPAKPEEIIRAIENPQQKVSPAVSKYIEQYRKLDDEVFKQAKELGLDIKYLKNHISHLWEQTPQQVEQAYAAFKQKYGLSNSRVIPSYDEGIKMGLKPKYTNPSQILAESVKKLEEVRAGIKAFTQLKDQGFIVPASVGIRERGFAPINAPGFPRSAGRVNEELGVLGNWYAPKEIADQLNRVFSPKDYGVIGNITSKTRNISGLVQDVGLSGGVPGTPANAFGAAQTIKESLAGRPIQAITSFIRSFSDPATRNFFEKNAGQIVKMQERNVPVRSNFTIENLSGKGMGKNLVEMVSNAFKGQFGEAGKNLGSIWQQAVNNPTFQRFMPQLQVRLFNDIERAALKQGKSNAADIAAQAVNNFYGITGSDVVARAKGIQDPLVQNFLGTFTFAPKFRESMVNFWLNNVKTIKNPIALENRANVSFIGGAIATYIAMDRINYALNGKHMSENPPGTEDKLLIPAKDGTVIGVPFLSSIATIPRALYREGKLLSEGNIKGAVTDAKQTYSSMLIKPVMDVLANSDYFGKKIYEDNKTAKEKFTAQAKYLMTQYLGHPYLKELFDERNQDDPAIIRLSRAMELPFRFYTNASLNAKEYYGARDKALKGLSDIEKSALDAIPKYDKEDPNDPNTRILKYQVFLTYPAVFEAKQKTELEMSARTGKAIDPLYLVDYETAKKYMRYETLPEGSKDRKAMTQAYPELIAMFQVRGKYFDENPFTGLGKSQRPVASAEVQAAMDRKDWTAPGVREYLDANTQWNNQQREKLGLPLLEGYGSFAKKPKKISAKKISFKKFKLSLPKASKVPTIKIAKAPKPKAQKKSKSVVFNIKPIQRMKLTGLTSARKLV